MKDKIKAFSIHLLLSSILALICLFLMFFVWYPSPLIQATGVGKLFLMMLAIDLILGPILTFIIYQKNKRSIKFDLFIIACIQISAIGYGIYSMYEGRPVWVAFTLDRFELIRANDVITENDHYPSSIFKPQYVFVNIKTKTAQEQLDMMLNETISNISPAQQPTYYRPFIQAKSNIQTQSKALKDLNQYNPAIVVERVLKKYPQANAFVPLKANAVDMTVLVNKDTAEIIKIVDLRPWK